MKPAALIAFIALICFILAPLHAADKKAPTTAPAIVTTAKPVIAPGTGEYKEPVKIIMKSGTPGATIRYTIDGKMPGPDSGLVYGEPITLDHTATLVAIAFKEGLPPSPISSGVYFIGDTAKPGLVTFHIGNSLTGTTRDFGVYARTAGYKHSYTSFIRGGALTKRLWDNEVTTEKLSWEKTFGAVPKIDVFTIQPRDFNLAEEAGYDVKFLNLVRAKSPDVQPWLYIEWKELNRSRWSDQGAVPSSEVKVQWPAMTWEESMAAMLLYGEELQKTLRGIDKEGKPIRVLPSGISMGWARNLVDHGKIPGMAPGEYNPIFFGKDSVHPNAIGAFLVDCTWFSAFYQQPPEGKVVPVNAALTPQQTVILQRLAWDVIENYPDCGIYKEGKTPAGKPEFHPAPSVITDITPITLSSATDGAWFRYTLDGSTPTSTNGYVYCGVISVRPGMTVKAVAYKNNSAPSDVMEATYSAGERNRELFHATGNGMHNLDLSLTGPFAQYIRHNGTQRPDSGLWPQVLSVGAPGQTIWISGSIRLKDDADATAELVLDSQTVKNPDVKTSIGVGYFGKKTSDAKSGKRWWSLRAGEQTFQTSEIAAEPGKATLLVLQIAYDQDIEKPAHLSVYVNPPLDGSQKHPHATIEVPPHFEWKSIGFNAAPDDAAGFEDLRVGESFGAVTRKP